MQTLDMMRKMESLINGPPNGYLCQSYENMKENLSFLQKELLAKDEFIKSLLETQTAILNSLLNSTSKPVSLPSCRNCSIQNEADKDKDKINQSNQKPEKNVSKIYIGNLNLSIKEIDLIELGLNTTNYLRETSSVNMPTNDNTGSLRDMRSRLLQNNVPNRLLKLNPVKVYSSQIKFEVAKSTRGQIIIVSSPAKN